MTTCPRAFFLCTHISQNRRCSPHGVIGWIVAIPFWMEVVSSRPCIWLFLLFVCENECKSYSSMGYHIPITVVFSGGTNSNVFEFSLASSDWLNPSFFYISVFCHVHKFLNLFGVLYSWSSFCLDFWRAFKIFIHYLNYLILYITTQVSLHFHESTSHTWMFTNVRNISKFVTIGVCSFLHSSDS